MQSLCLDVKVGRKSAVADLAEGIL